MFKKSKNFFSSKMLLIHPRWSRMVPKHPPDPRGCFSTIRTPQKKFGEFFEKSKFQLQNAFFAIGCFTNLKKAFGKVTQNRTCFSIFMLRSNALRGAKFGIIQLKRFLSNIYLGTHFSTYYSRNCFQCFNDFIR